MIYGLKPAKGAGRNLTPPLISVEGPLAASVPLWETDDFETWASDRVAYPRKEVLRAHDVQALHLSIEQDPAGLGSTAEKRRLFFASTSFSLSY